MSNNDDDDDDDKNLDLQRPQSYASLVSRGGRAVRIFYDEATGALDPAGDAELRTLQLSDPFAADPQYRALDRYTQLVSRPFFYCKPVDEPSDDIDSALFQSISAGSELRLLCARPPRSRAADLVTWPFDDSALVEPIVLFDDATLVPLLVVRLGEAESARRGSASGLVVLIKEDLF
jgi:hypothetical protein